VTSTNTPKTMAELLASAKNKIVRFGKGDKVEGVVLEITPKALILDIGGKSEGIVAEKAFLEARDFIRNLKVGDKVRGEVIVSETPDGFTVISLRNSAKDFVWEKINSSYDEGHPISVQIMNVNPMGLIADVHGLSGFIPTSQIGKELAKNLGNLQGKNVEAMIIDVDRDSNKIVLSERAVSEKEQVEAEKKAMETIKEGELFEGIVTTVSDFGVFVKIHAGKVSSGVDLEGLVHISELSWEKVGKPSDVLSVGNKVKVKVIEKRNGKLALSIKDAKEDPWIKVEEKYSPEMHVKGRVVKMSDFGAFVELEPGIEGLIHMTKIPPATKLKSGDEVSCTIEEVDLKEKRISLGLVLSSKPLGYK
jgi:small subunit ribosomal protein S1